MHVQQASDVGTSKIKIGGFALPTVLIASLVMLTVLLVSVSSTTAVSTSIKSQYYGTLASSAAEAGLAYAKACLDGNGGVAAWSDANPLTPKTNCSGVSQPSNPDTVMTGTNIRSSFSVGAPTISGDSRTVRSLGTVSLLRASNQAVWRTYQQVRSASTQAPSSTPILNFDKVFLGTNANNAHSCGISAGKAYCWGSNTNGQLGNNSTTNSTLPVAVNTSGVLAGRTVTEMAIGRLHTCAVANGAAFCWGSGTNSQLGNNSTAQSLVPVAVTTTGVLSGRTVTAIASATYSSCVIANGAPFCWGNGASGSLGNSASGTSAVPVAVTTTGVLSGRTATRITGGNQSFCVVANGAAFCWGLNSNGQLGNNSTTLSNAPVAVTATGVLSGRIVTDISVGYSHSCAVANGAAFCWGENSTSSALGNNSTVQSLVPVAVDATGVLSGKTVTNVVAGRYHSCGIASGSAFCWGYDYYGNLGNGNATSGLVPVAVDTSGVLGTKTVTYMAAGEEQTCVTANGTSYCWGGNTDGEVGDNAPTLRVISPVAVNTSTLVNNAMMTSITTGGSHSCGISYGRAYCWGNNSSGQLGNNNLTAYSLVPVPVDTSGVLSGKSVTTISAGANHTCAIANGAAFCWGSGGNGQLGNNVLAQSPVPVAVDTSTVMSGRTVTDITAGDVHTCAVANGAAFCWGSNTNGRLGNNSLVQSSVPVAVTATGVLSGRTVTSMAAGVSHTCAVANGAAFCWGAGTNGQLGNNTSSASIVPVAVTATGVLSGRTVTSMAAGNSFTCAVANGAAFCWGVNSFGNLGNNSTTQSLVAVAVTATGVLSGRTVVDVSAGASYNCAIANGAAFCWGANNAYGSLGNNSTAQSNVAVAVTATGVLSGRTITDIAGFQFHTCAVGNGLPFCWGSNSWGQLGINNLTPTVSLVPVTTITSGFTPPNLIVPGFYVIF